VTKIIPLPKSKEFIEATENEVILSGGYGAGKSISLCLKAVFLSLRYPKNRIFIGRKYLQAFKTTTYKTLLEGDGNMPPILPKEYIVNHNKTDRTILLVNGSEIIYDGVDIEKIKSLNLGAAAIDECGELTEQEWDALNARLRLSGVPIHQLFGCTNPYSVSHWIWNRFKENPPRDEFGNPTVKLIQTSTYENYHLPKSYIDNLKQTLYGFYYQRYVEGNWVGADSLVYDNFDPKIHVIPSFEIPKDWKRFRSIDFGYTSPYSCGWFAQVPEDLPKHNLKRGDVILYREYYYTKRTSGMNAQKIKEYSVYPDGTPEKIEWTVCDWDSGDRADLEAVGIKTRPADKKDKLGRIQRVRQFLGNRDINNGAIVRPTLYIFENSLVEFDPKIRINLETGERNNDPTNSVEEFLAYSRKPRKSGEPVSDEPLDKYDHAMDMISYFVTEYKGIPKWVDIPFKTLDFKVDSVI